MSKMTFVVPVKNENMMEAVSESIRRVRGGNDKIVFIQNSPSMAKALNQGILESPTDRVCIIHEDVEIRESAYWQDEILDNLFETRNVGFLGAAGSKDLFPDGRWHIQGNRMCGGVIHGQVYKDGDQMPQQVVRRPDGTYYAEWFTRYGDYGRTVVLDGVCLITEKSVLDAIGGFDEETYRNAWHYYDMDVTLRAHLAGYHNIAIPLFMRHMSLGSYNDQWMATKTTFLKKWVGKLPVVMDFDQDYIIERMANLQLRNAGAQ